MSLIKNSKNNKEVSVENYDCHDCGKKIELNNEELIEGKLLVYQDGDEKINIVKCDSCYEKNPGLNNFRKTEVYSRIVGYIRPVNQWNPGKTQEFKERKKYEV